MSYTVADLLADASLNTYPIIPGVGEQRVLTWAHVCELRDPWNWLGEGALVMTTGLAIPEAPDEQVAYIESSHAAGIACVAISEEMNAPVMSRRMLNRARELGFPLLRTSLHQPFISIAQAVNRANTRRQEERLAKAQRIYESLTEHLVVADLQSLLNELGRLLEGTLSIRAISEPQSRQPEEWLISLPFATHPDLRLEYRAPHAVSPDRQLLQYANAAVTALLEIRRASRRRDSAQGSLLLNRLISERIDVDTAKELLQAHGMTQPYRIVTWRFEHPEQRAEAMSHSLAERGFAHLSILREPLIVFMVPALDESVNELVSLSDARKVGVSAAFRSLTEVHTAFRQSRTALDFPSREKLNFYEDRHGFSPFLGVTDEALQETALGLLQPLIDNDAERGTLLLVTLRVFLEENRNWKQTAARLHVHRQTLYARIARIEALTHRDLSTVAALSDFWLALQTASSLGLLNEIPTHTHI